VWLVLSSLVFYATLGIGYLPVLIGSVLMNFVAARVMMRLPEQSRARRAVLVAGLVANLLLLAAYKYTGFLAENINALFGTDLKALSRTYPVGLSFYTFIQLGFLLDVYVGNVARLRFVRYSLFGTFFPYITAGPLVRQDEVFSQLDTPVRERTGVVRIAVGATMFAMGLFKKAVLADSIAPHVATLFDSAGAVPVSPTNAWIGALAYTFELYFDFSGYSDMAIGLGYMLGIKLPLNFNSPLKATSLVDFWRRWHMTMVRFFTSYVYTPLAATMMRRTIRRRLPEPLRLLLVLCLPVFVTFVLVGFWHGAGWGFIISGAIHGVGLSVNLTWRELQARVGLPRIPGLVGWVLMMLPLVASLVYLRAANAGTATKILGAMVGVGASQTSPGTFFGTQTLFGVTYVPAVTWMLLLAAVALLFPRNTQQILDRYEVGLPTLPAAEPKPRFTLRWQPSLQWGVAIAVVAGLALVFAGGPSPFLYYRY
jgi:alginate O-acetyltransferase complex protein AlgI